MTSPYNSTCTPVPMQIVAQYNIVELTNEICDVSLLSEKLFDIQLLHILALSVLQIYGEDIRLSPIMAV